jgi:hypothetical protein
MLAAFELAVGLLILAGGRKTTLGLVAAVAFHLGLMLFGWGFCSWSSPCSPGWLPCCATTLATP